MSIVKMKRLRLIGMQSERDGLLQQLQHLGCVEIAAPEEMPGTSPDDAAAWDAFARPDGQALTQAKEARAGLDAALAALKKYAPEKSSLFAPRPQVTEQSLFDQQSYQTALSTAGQINDLLQRLNSAKAEQARARAQEDALQPWREVDLPLETASTRDVAILLAAVNASADWDAVSGAVAAATDLAELTKAGKDRELQYFVLVCHKSAEQDALDALKPFGFTHAAPKGWTGTAAENIKRLEREIERLDREQAELASQLEGFGKQRGALTLALERAAQEIGREEAKSRLIDTDKAYLLEGWCPASEQGRLEQVLQSHVCTWELADPTPDEYPKVPVQLKNNAFSRPMNMVTEMYSLPAYDGLDPNPLMAPFFILFYGIMMADMAYGLIMIAASLFVLTKMKPKGTMHHMFALAGQCGVTTFVFGALTGGFFGDFIPQLLKMINPASTFEMPYLFTPLNDTMMILIGSLVLGFIQVITGMAISFIKQTMDGHFLDALFNEGSWWVIFVGIGLAIANIGTVGGVPVVLVIGGVMLVIGCLRQTPSIAVVGTLIGAVYNGVTGVFQDVLSYSRLMALMLSGSIIAQVFNTLGSVTGNVVAFVIIALIGNMLNFTLNILGCFVHNLRLQCLEFFGRFYKDGGRPFKPLAINTKYVDVKS